MNLAIVIFLFILGLFLIIKGGDYFVDAASWIATVSGIPKLIIGATVVSIATTLPEMLVSVMAAVDGKVDMSIGNAVGSVTANIGLIMAISLICLPSVIKRSDYMLKSVLMLLGAVIIVLCGFSGKVSVIFSILLLVIFAVFFTENILGAKKAMGEKKESEEKDENLTAKKTVIINILKFVGGAAGIVIGARLLVDRGSELAALIGISERIIGVTMVAVGTSLPELITTVTAVIKKQSELSVGNIIGANIMDLTLIMPLSAIISGKSLPIKPSSAYIDLPACLLVGIIALVPSLITKKFSRIQGILLLAVYIGYVVLTCTVTIA